MPRAWDNRIYGKTTIGDCFKKLTRSILGSVLGRMAGNHAPHSLTYLQFELNIVVISLAIAVISLKSKSSTAVASLTTAISSPMNAVSRATNTTISEMFMTTV